jgi:hypothetical protein
MTQGEKADPETETLREIADTYGLSKLPDANLVEVENALAFAQSLTERLPNTLIPSDEPAHVFPAGYFTSARPGARKA